MSLEVTAGRRNAPNGNHPVVHAVTQGYVLISGFSIFMDKNRGTEWSVTVAVQPRSCYRSLV